MRGSQLSILYGVLLFVLAAFVGCGGESGGGAASSSTEGDEPTSSAEASEDIKTYAIADLPAMDDRPMPAGDSGRVEFKLPEGWKPVKNPKFIVAGVPEENSAAKLPRITLAADESPGGVDANTTEANAGELAAALQEPMKKRPPIENCTRIKLGDITFVRHVRKAAQSGGEPVAIQSLQTVRGGRLYTVELTVNAKDNPASSKVPIIYAKELKAHRDFAYAVAANLKFPKEGGSAPPATEAPAPEAPADKPAEPSKSE